MTGVDESPWRRNLYVLWVAEVLTIGGFSMCYPFLPLYLAELGATSFDARAWWSGALTAASAGCMAVAAPFWGMAADRWGRKPMVVRAMVCGAVSTGLMGLVVAPWQLLVLFVLDGALSGTVAAAMTLVAATTPRARLGYALGLLQTAIFTGMSLGPLAGGLLADALGYRPVFAVSFVMLLAAALLTLALTRETFARPARAVANTARTSPRLLGVLLAGALPAAVGSMLVLRATTGAVMPVLPLFVEELAGLGAPVASLTGLTFGVSGLGSAVAALTLGRVADRLGHRRVLVGSALAVALLFVPLALVQTPWQLAVGYGLLGVATGGIVPSAHAVVAAVTSVERRGLVFGVASAAGSLGGFAGPLGGSFLATAADVRWVFVASGALMLGCAGWLVVALRSATFAGVGVEPAEAAPVVS